MPYKPFLSHKREDAADLAVLRQELILRGAGGWQDVEDLRVGQRVGAALERAIGRETGGFIWYGTRNTLRSKVIRRVEMPAALRRARKRTGGSYPLVPLFVDLSPVQDRKDIEKAFGRRRTRQLLDFNGEVREAGESVAGFARRAARRYVRDLVRTHDGPLLRVAITGGREPTGAHDLSLDWRPLLDGEGRLADPTFLPTLVETLTDIRDAAQRRHACPHLVVEPHLRLPLAVLVGWQWNRIRPTKLTVVQPRPEGLLEVPDRTADAGQLPAPRHWDLSGDGPAVVALSVGKDLGDAVLRYAESQASSEATHLHISLDGRPGRALSADDICGLAQWAIEQLADLNARDLAKHLLLLGPVSLAVRIGAAANGTGKTFVPFWNGEAGYDNGILIV